MRSLRPFHCAAGLFALGFVMPWLGANAPSADPAGAFAQARSADRGLQIAPPPRRSQTQQNPDLPQPDMNAPLTPKQQRALMKASYEKMKGEADELAGLAKSLQAELNKSNQNVLSLDVVDKAEKIEKLAKKIKNEALNSR